MRSILKIGMLKSEFQKNSALEMTIFLKSGSTNATFS